MNCVVCNKELKVISINSTGRACSIKCYKEFHLLCEVPSCHRKRDNSKLPYCTEHLLFAVSYTNLVPVCSIEDCYQPANSPSGFCDGHIDIILKNLLEELENRP